MTTHALTQGPNRSAYTADSDTVQKFRIYILLLMFYSLTADIWGISVPLTWGRVGCRHVGVLHSATSCICQNLVRSHWIAYRLRNHFRVDPGCDS